VLGALARLAATRRRQVRPPSAGSVLADAGVSRPQAEWTRSDRLRVAIAVACAVAPSHVLLEVEPPLERKEERRALADLVRRVLATGRGMLIGTRDELLLAEVATHVLIFDDGAVLAEGPPGSVLTAASRRVKGGDGA
jgi:ABC-type histidine transport system ATPase subunit